MGVADAGAATPGADWESYLRSIAEWAHHAGLLPFSPPDQLSAPERTSGAEAEGGLYRVIINQLIAGTFSFSLSFRSNHRDVRLIENNTRFVRGKVTSTLYSSIITFFSFVPSRSASVVSRCPSQDLSC